MNDERIHQLETVCRRWRKRKEPSRGQLDPFICNTRRVFSVLIIKEPFSGSVFASISDAERGRMLQRALDGQ